MNGWGWLLDVTIVSKNFVVVHSFFKALINSVGKKIHFFLCRMSTNLCTVLRQLRRRLNFHCLVLTPLQCYRDCFNLDFDSFLKTGEKVEHFDRRNTQIRDLIIRGLYIVNLA